MMHDQLDGLHQISCEMNSEDDEGVKDTRVKVQVPVVLSCDTLPLCPGQPAVLYILMVSCV